MQFHLFLLSFKILEFHKLFSIYAHFQDDFNQSLHLNVILCSIYTRMHTHSIYLLLTSQTKILISLSAILGMQSTSSMTFSTSRTNLGFAKIKTLLLLYWGQQNTHYEISNIEIYYSVILCITTGPLQSYTGQDYLGTR